MLCLLRRHLHSVPFHLAVFLPQEHLLCKRPPETCLIASLIIQGFPKTTIHRLVDLNTCSFLLIPGVNLLYCMWTCSVLQTWKSWLMWKTGPRMWSLITEQLFQLVLLPINNSRAETVSTFMRQRDGEILQVSRSTRCERHIYDISLSLCNAPVAMNHLECNKRDRGDGVSYFWTTSCRRLQKNQLFISLSKGFALFCP